MIQFSVFSSLYGSWAHMSTCQHLRVEQAPKLTCSSLSPDPTLHTPSLPGLSLCRMWQDHSFIGSSQKHRIHPRLLSSAHISHPIQQQNLLSLSSDDTQNLITTHLLHCYHLGPIYHHLSPNYCVACVTYLLPLSTPYFQCSRQGDALKMYIR